MRRLRHIPLAALAFLLVAAEQAAYAVWRGIAWAPDSDTYQAWADTLLRVHFDVPAFLRVTTSDYPPLLYVVWVSVVAGVRSVLGDDWDLGIVVINVIASAAAAAIAVRVTERLTGSRPAAVAVGVLWLASVDIADWSRYALSDPTYLLLTVGAFALAAAGLLGARRRAAAALVMLPVLTFYRPTFVAMLPLLLAASLAGLAGTRAVQTLGTPAAARRALGAVVAACVAGLGAFAALMREPARWPLRAGAGLMRFTAAHWRLGEVIWDRTSTFRPPPHTVRDFLVLAGVRLAAFFTPFSPDYERPLRAVQIAFSLCAYPLALVGVAAALRRSAWLDAGRRCVVLLAAALVVVVATFHAMAEIDYDWRYRVPVLPYVMLLAAVGAAALGRGRSRRADPRGP
jgi:hypothetical protein